MIEPTIVFTQYALLLTAVLFLLIGSLIGWAVTNYLRAREISQLKSELKEVQISLTAINENHESQENQTGTTGDSAALSSLNKKKDRLLKNFIRRQMQQKKLLEKTRTTLGKERESALALEKRLDRANASLDQWKQKCSVLAAANTSLRNHVTQSGNTKQENAKVVIAGNTAAAATFQLKPAKGSSVKTKPVAPVAAKQKPQVSLTISKPQAASNSVTPGDQSEANTNQPQMPAQVDEKQIAKVISNVEKTPETQSHAKTTTDAGLRRITGIGPAIESALKELGIMNLQQMASLQTEDVRRLDKQLGKYSGRIVRQDWVKQAEQLLQTATQQTEAA